MRQISADSLYNKICAHHLVRFCQICVFHAPYPIKINYPEKKIAKKPNLPVSFQIRCRPLQYEKKTT